MADQLRQSADHAGEAARSAAALRPSRELSSAAAAIPGAGAAQLLGQVALKWDRDLRAWSERARWFGVRLEIAAAAYQRGDDASAKEFTSLRLDPA